MTRTVTVTVAAPPLVTATTIASVSSAGITANNRSLEPSLSTDGRLVAFISQGTNLVPDVRTSPLNLATPMCAALPLAVTTFINQTPAGDRSSHGVTELKLAAGGRYAIFTSLAGDLVADDTNGSLDVFVRDLQAGITRRVSLRGWHGNQPAGNGVRATCSSISRRTAGS